jgi:hypothetical protein
MTCACDIAVFCYDWCVFSKISLAPLNKESIIVT